MNLYLKYRPQEFDQVIGNADVVSYLKTAVSDKSKCPHVFLFHGPTGCGKTTLARIVAKNLGCDPLDMKEVNTADFRGIDTVREMIKNSKYGGLGGDVRVWLIDEVHKMTNDAQNAFLKLLEDSPAQAYFILCTTDPNKLLPTLKGRCQQLGVKPLTDSQMMQLLKPIVKAEKKALDQVVYDQIIQDSFGHSRNALQILDRVLMVPKEQRLKMAQESAAQQSESIALCRALIDRSGWKKVAGILQGLKDQEAESIRRHVLGYAQSILLNGKEDDRVAFVLECFKDHFYDSGFPALVYACYSVVKG